MGDPALSRRGFLAASAAAGLGMTTLTGCGGDSDGGSSDGTTTVEWWNISTTEPGRRLGGHRQGVRGRAPQRQDQDHRLENEAFKAKLTTAHPVRATRPTSSRPGAAACSSSRSTRAWSRTSPPTSPPGRHACCRPSLQPYQFDGKTYGVPFDIGMVGFWYNKELFAKAGITAPPATWAEFLDDVKKLKAAGITPIALAGKDKWPGHFYWAYLAMRIGGLAALQQAADDQGLHQPRLRRRPAQQLKELVDLQPFQKGFLGAELRHPGRQAATMGNGKAAMELMGQWAPAVQATLAARGLGDDLGFFPFPAVEGGKGAATEAFGGGGGFAVGKDAPAGGGRLPEVHLPDVDNQRKAVETGAVLPVVKGAEDAIKDPNIKVVAETLAAATGFQLYLDQAYPPAVGQQVNDSVAELIAGTQDAGAGRRGHHRDGEDQQ